MTVRYFANDKEITEEQALMPNGVVRSGVTIRTALQFADSRLKRKQLRDPQGPRVRLRRISNTKTIRIAIRTPTTVSALPMALVATVWLFIDQDFANCSTTTLAVTPRNRRMPPPITQLATPGVMLIRSPVQPAQASASSPARRKATPAW